MRRLTDRLSAARRDDRGFTLIELLIVIIILGVLAAVVVFSVRGITNNSEEAACKTDKRIVNTAIEAYYAEKGSYKDGGGANIDTADLIAANLLKEAPGYVTSIDHTDADNPKAVATC